MRKKFRNPRRPWGRRSAHGKRGIDRLERRSRRIIEPEIGLLVAVGPKAVQVRLVPDLEAPFLHFVLSETRLEMAGEGGNEVCPPAVVFWRGSVGVPVEDS